VAALKQLRYSVYDAGNADYAGRSVFTGYRTGMTLTFPEQEEKQYTITEARDATFLDDITFIQTEKQTGGTKECMTDVNAGNYTTSTLTEQDMSTTTIRRIRLAYNNLDTDVDVSSKDGDQAVTFKYWGETGWTTMGDDAGEIQTMSLYGSDNPYEAMAEYNKAHAGSATADFAIFVPETGELLLSDSMYAKLNATKDNPKTDDKDEGRISITYSKTKWEKGDLKPEHYFYCESDKIKYNEEKLGVRDTRQDICYDLGSNQDIQVNTLAEDAIVHAIGRDVDDIIQAIEDVEKMEQTIKSLESANPESDTDKETLKRNLDAANKALTYLQDKLKNLFEGGITKMQGHMDRVVLAQTDLGTRGSKLDLVKKRLSDEKTTFKELVKENEQVDTAEVATDLASAKNAYDAALMATSKVIQNSLMNYI
jgi:flagellar hook-associated protein 3 FlgL